MCFGATGCKGCCNERAPENGNDAGAKAPEERTAARTFGEIYRCSLDDLF
jgi:hypothetical protein